MVVVITVLVAVTVVYLRPPGRQTVDFVATDAAALSTGEDVRIAGVSVGKVARVALRPDHVLVSLSISDTDFVGDQSRVEVRMLTAVGGYYVTLVPLGTAPIGDQAIPADRVSLPYSISDVLQEAPQLTDKANPQTIEADLKQFTDGLAHNSASIGSLIKGLNTIAGIMAQQRDQVRSIMGLAAEYTQTINKNRTFVFDLIRRTQIVLNTFYNARDGFNLTYRLLGDVLMRLAPVEQFYLNHKLEIRAVVNQIRGAIRQFQSGFGPTIDQLNEVRSRLESWLTPDGIREVGNGIVLGSDVCIPVPGRNC